jgi:hypothetical protein
VAVLREHLHHTLAELGAAAAACVLVRGAGRAARICGPAEAPPGVSHG